MTDKEKTLRDEIAINALNGMLAHSTRYKPREGSGVNWHWSIAKEAYELADAMLNAKRNANCEGLKMADKLLPCPFCGGEATIKKCVDGTWCVSCDNCTMVVMTPVCASEKRAIELWNYRSNWHTGTPTEEGDYLTKISYGNNSVLYEVRRCYCYPDIGLSFNPFIEGKVIAWQKIEEGEEVNG